MSKRSRAVDPRGFTKQQMEAVSDTPAWQRGACEGNRATVKAYRLAKTGNAVVSNK